MIYFLIGYSLARIAQERRNDMRKRAGLPRCHPADPASRFQVISVIVLDRAGPDV